MSAVELELDNDSVEVLSDSVDQYLTLHHGR